MRELQEMALKDLYLEKNRYRYLKEVVEHYPIWCSDYIDNEPYCTCSSDPYSVRKGFNDPTQDTALNLIELKEKIDCVIESAKEADPIGYPYIILAATQNYRYEYMCSNLGLKIPRGELIMGVKRFFYVFDKKWDKLMDKQTVCEWDC